MSKMKYVSCLEGGGPGKGYRGLEGEEVKETEGQGYESWAEVVRGSGTTYCRKMN